MIAAKRKIFNSKCLYDCIRLLELLNHHQVEFILGKEGNKKIDELAISELSLDQTMACNDILTSLALENLKPDGRQSTNTECQRRLSLSDVVLF